MRVETYICPDCGTVVAANVLERDRRVKCPGLGCDRVISFEDLAEDVQEHYETHTDRYRME